MIRINLAPPEGRGRRAGPGFQLRLPEFNLGLVLGVLYVLTLVGVGGWWWRVRGDEADLTVKVKQSTDELAALKARIGQAGKVNERLAELKKRVDAIQELTKTQTRPIKLLDALADVMPRDLWLSGLEEKGTTLRITGSSLSATGVSNFMSNLRASGRFKDVDIIVSRQDLTKTPSLVTFEVTCRFES